MTAILGYVRVCATGQDLDAQVAMPRPPALICTAGVDLYR